MVGGEAGLGKGFYYTLAGMVGGRMQTSARAYGQIYIPGLNWFLLVMVLVATQFLNIVNLSFWVINGPVSLLAPFVAMGLMLAGRGAYRAVMAAGDEARAMAEELRGSGRDSSAQKRGVNVTTGPCA